MLHYNYLIIGSGMTADAAVDGIRQIDPEGTIGLIGAEAEPPYNRPPPTSYALPISQVSKKGSGGLT